MVPFSIVKTHIKMISSLLMYKSVLLLSHQQYLSIYDLRYKSWVQTLDMGEGKEIVRLIITSNEKILVGLSDTTWIGLTEHNSADGATMTFEKDPEPHSFFGQKAKIEKLVTEQSNYSRYYCLVKDSSGAKKIYILKNTTFTEDRKIKPSENFFCNSRRSHQSVSFIKVPFRHQSGS